MPNKLIPIAKVQAECPDWPYSPWSTGHLIRQGRLECVRVGKRVFVTPTLLERFVEAHTTAKVG